MAKTTKSTNIQTKKPTQKATTKKTSKTKGIKIADTEIKISDVNDELNEFEAMLDETLAEVEKKKAKTEPKVLNKAENAVEKVAEETVTVEKVVEEVAQTEEKAENSTEVELTTKTGTEVIKKAEEVIAEKEVEQLFSIGTETVEEKSKTHSVKKITAYDVCDKMYVYLDITGTPKDDKTKPTRVHNFYWIDNFNKDNVLNADIESDLYKKTKVFWSDKNNRTCTETHFWYETPMEFVARYNRANPDGVFKHPVCPICQARKKLAESNKRATAQNLFDYLTYNVTGGGLNEEKLTLNDLLINKIITEKYYKEYKEDELANKFLDAGFTFTANDYRKQENNTKITYIDSKIKTKYTEKLADLKFELSKAEEARQYYENKANNKDKEIESLNQIIEIAQERLNRAKEDLERAKAEKKEKEKELIKERSEYNTSKSNANRSVKRIKDKIIALKEEYGIN